MQWTLVKPQAPQALSDIDEGYLLLCFLTTSDMPTSPQDRTVVHHPQALFATPQAKKSAVDHQMICMIISLAQFLPCYGSC